MEFLLVVMTAGAQPTRTIEYAELAACQAVFSFVPPACA